MNNILTSSTEPYDLSLSRSFQNLSHLPPSYELALKSDSCKSSFLSFHYHGNTSFTSFLSLLSDVQSHSSVRSSI